MPAASAGLSRALCDAVARLRYEDLPPAVVATVKRFVLDALGLIGGAARAPGVAALNARLARWEPEGAATGLLGKRRYSPPTAALANGAAAHALDFDDLHDLARVHTSPIVLPVALACAEDVGDVDGRRFLLAMAVGAEVHARLGLACRKALDHGWHPTMIFGALAGSLAAGKLLELDGERLADAFGLAFHQTSGSAQSMHDGVLAKRMGAGFAARAAVLAAALANDGITGIRQTLEGSAGLFALYERGEVEPEAVLDGWGDRWEIPAYSFKPYPGCRCNHTAIGLAIGLHREGVRAADIAAIEIGLGRVNWQTVGQPYDPALGSVVHAQFNVAFSVAYALVNGRVGLEAYEPRAINDRPVVELAAATRAVVDSTIDAQAIAPARLRVRLTDGRAIEVTSTIMPGSPQAPLEQEEFERKVRDCFGYGLAAHAGAAERLIESVRQLDKAPRAAAVLCTAFPD